MQSESLFSKSFMVAGNSELAFLYLALIHSEFERRKHFFRSVLGNLAPKVLSTGNEVGCSAFTAPLAGKSNK